MKGICIVEKDRLDILELPEPELGPYDRLWDSGIRLV